MKTEPDELDVKPEPIGTDEFLRAYIECALWSSTDDEGEPLDGIYSVDDIAPETLASMREDCVDFLASNLEDIGIGDWAQAGHDFWLTRNGHGAGFWDGDWPAEAGRRLTEASHPYGEVNLYVGDDGLIYIA